MSLAIKYEGVADANMRLKGTVVLYEGNPVYIRNVVAGEKDEILRVQADPIPIKPRTMDEAEMRKYISSKKFDIAPFKMGYVNAPTGCFYCSRLPSRQQKQGLSSETFTGRDHRGNAVPFSNFTTCKEVVAMVKGDYPSFEVAKRALAKCPSVAFDREFALMKDDILGDTLLRIYHKGKQVGAYLDGKVTLGKNFECLKESLVELGLKVS